MTDLLSLAGRVEAAMGADRELMCACYKAVFPEVSAGAWDAIDAWDAGYDRFSAMLDVGAPIDAALSLVPEGWVLGALGEAREWSPHGGDHLAMGWKCCLRRTSGDEFVSAATPHPRAPWGPALALTAAALKARAAMQEKG